MGKFEKGHKGLKPKGVPNKRTVEDLKRIEYVLGLLEETLDDDLKKLEPRERAKMWESLQEYKRPKLARTEITGKDGESIKTESVIDLSKLTLEQLEAIKGAIKDTNDK